MSLEKVLYHVGQAEGAIITAMSKLKPILKASEKSSMGSERSNELRHMYVRLDDALSAVMDVSMDVEELICT